MEARQRESLVSNVGDTWGSNESEIALVKFAPMGSCNGGCVHSCHGNIRRSRCPSSVDSGLGCSLDPISEKQEYCAMGDQTNVPDGQRRRLDANANPAGPNGSKIAVSNRCENHEYSQVPFDLDGEYEVPNVAMQRMATPHVLEQGLVQNHQTKSPSDVPKYETVIPTSDHLQSGFISNCGSNGNGKISRPKCNPGITLEKGSRKKQKTRRIFCHPINLVSYCLIVVLVITLATFVVVYFLRSDEIRKAQDKIATLEKAIDGMKTFIPTSLADMTDEKNPSGRPRMHLVLKNQASFHENGWNEKSLEWKPVITGDAGLQYNEKTNALIVQDPGVYFVYDQIYVYRHLSRKSEGMNRMSNHTIFHMIYKRPFNFPRSRKPPLVSESVLSNCWNSEARNQIHSSYQGMVVELRKHEELIVTLQSYDESIDTLQPTTTFFGAFKL